MTHLLFIYFLYIFRTFSRVNQEFRNFLNLFDMFTKTYWTINLKLIFPEMLISYLLPLLSHHGIKTCPMRLIYTSLKRETFFLNGIIMLNKSGPCRHSCIEKNQYFAKHSKHFSIDSIIFKQYPHVHSNYINIQI